ncbi:hypothetical protein BJX66DRAFT_320172 [Aspergillus keveii]|uniref:Secreted protein n=1 Tax=Aspergillus keveii TaxID=714993 RepID=A0ABR4FHD5_9EURO
MAKLALLLSPIFMKLVIAGWFNTTCHNIAIQDMSTVLTATCERKRENWGHNNVTRWNREASVDLNRCIPLCGGTCDYCIVRGTALHFAKCFRQDDWAGDWQSSRTSRNIVLDQYLTNDDGNIICDTS